MYVMITYKNHSIKQIVETVNITLAQANSFSFYIPTDVVFSFTTSIKPYYANCTFAVSTLMIQHNITSVGYGCNPVFQWMNFNLTLDQNVSLTFNEFNITLGVDNTTGLIGINSLRPRYIIPNTTPKPKSMLLSIGDFMKKLKKADECPNFLLNVSIGSTVVYNDMTYSQCEIQLTFSENLSVGDKLTLAGEAEGYQPLA